MDEVYIVTHEGVALADCLERRGYFAITFDRNEESLTPYAVTHIATGMAVHMSAENDSLLGLCLAAMQEIPAFDLQSMAQYRPRIREILQNINDGMEVEP